MQAVTQVVGGVLGVLLWQQLQGVDQHSQELRLALHLQRLEGTHLSLPSSSYIALHVYSTVNIVDKKKEMN